MHLRFPPKQASEDKIEVEVWDVIDSVLEDEKTSVDDDDMPAGE